MDQPLVSIVVVSYNQGKYIKENLDSINSQTYDNIQLIVADDASKDTTVEVFDNWLLENNYSAEKNYHQKNTGLATILNECLKLAKGRYLKIIAADDYLHPEYIEKCLSKLIEEQSHVVFTQATSIDNDSHILKSDFFSIPDNPIENIEEKISFGNFISGSTLFYDMTILKTIGNYKKDILLEDYDFILRVISADFKISFINKNLVYYRQHETNISKTKLIALEAETEILKYKYFKARKFANTINHSTSQKINLYGKEFVKLIFIRYICYNCLSKRTLLKMIKNLL